MTKTKSKYLKKIKKILDSKWNKKRCPYCSFRARHPIQTIHHITNCHNERYHDELTKEARIFRLFCSFRKKRYEP